MELIKLWTSWSRQSTNRKILSATIVIIFLSFSAKLITMAKEIIIAASFGTADALDAFLVAFLIPMFAINVIGGSFNAALIPTYVRVKKEEGRDAAHRLFSNVMIWSLGLLGVTTIIMVLTAPYFMPIIATGFSAQKLTFTLNMFYVISPVVVIYGINTIWGAVLNASEQFALVAITPVITPAVIILFLWLGRSWGISALALGTVCGIIIETVLLGIALSRQGISLWPKWYGKDPHLREVAGQYLPMITGAFLLGSTIPINQGMAASLGPGSVAALNYGNKAIGFPLNLAAASLGTAVIPYFSIMVVNRNWSGIHHTLKKYSRLIFAVTIPLTCLLAVMSEPIVRILFQRGSFTVQDTQLVGRIQALFAIQMPFYISGILIVRLISAFKGNNLLMWGAVISIVVNVVMNYVLIKWMGVSGIALSTSIVYFVSFCYLSYMLKRLMKKAASEL